MNKNLQQFLSTLVQAALRNAMPKRNKDEGKRKKGKQSEAKSSAPPVATTFQKATAPAMAGAKDEEKGEN